MPMPASDDAPPNSDTGLGLFGESLSSAGISASDLLGLAAVPNPDGVDASGSAGASARLGDAPYEGGGDLLPVVDTAAVSNHRMHRGAAHT